MPPPPPDDPEDPWLPPPLGGGGGVCTTCEPGDNTNSANNDQIDQLVTIDEGFWRCLGRKLSLVCGDPLFFISKYDSNSTC